MAYMHADKRSGLHQPIPKIQHKAMDNFGKKKEKRKKEKETMSKNEKRKQQFPSTQTVQSRHKFIAKLR